VPVEQDRIFEQWGSRMCVKYMSPKVHACLNQTCVSKPQHGAAVYRLNGSRYFVLKETVGKGERPFDPFMSSRTPLADQLIALSGEKSFCGQRKFAMEVSIPAGLAYSGHTPTSVSPWTQSAVVDVLPIHDVSVFDSLRYSFSAGPAIFGRAVTLRYAFKSERQPLPSANVPWPSYAGYTIRTFGAAQDPTYAATSGDFPFSAQRLDVLSDHNFALGSRIQLIYEIDSVDTGTPVAGTVFTLTITGEYSSYGFAFQ